jgi:hypothetical protein
MRTRSGEGFGSVYIDYIRGRMRGNVMFNLGNANAVENLNIGSLDVEYEYVAADSGLPSQWCNFEDVERFSIRDFKARIIDINDVLTTEEFRFRLPTVTKRSELYNPTLEILDSDESTVSSAAISITGAFQNYVEFIRNDRLRIISKTASFTIAKSDFNNGKVLYQADVSTAFDITVPQDSDEDIPNGSIAYVEAQDAQGTVVAGTGATLNPATEVKTDTSLEAPLIAIVKVAADTWQVYGGVS